MELSEKIRTQMEKSGIRVKKILQMNAGLRSRHTNAYFTGIGKTKQIVLFDTLIESHTHDEILAVLAHEASSALRSVDRGDGLGTRLQRSHGQSPPLSDDSRLVGRAVLVSGFCNHSAITSGEVDVCHRS